MVRHKMIIVGRLNAGPDTADEAVRMGWSAATFGRAACCAAVLSACAIAGVIVAWPSGQDPVVATVDGDTLFPDVKEGAAAPAAEVPPAGVPAAPELDELQRALFSPHLAMPQTGTQPTGAMLARPAEPRPAPAPLAAAGKRTVAESGRRNGRAVTVLNDAQIASIKQRLNLTPDQEQMWPAVEVALRKLAYAKRDGGSRKPGASEAAARLAMIDPQSDDVQHLKSAAVPLIMSFSEDQERELRILAQIAGLDKLMPGKTADRP